MDEMLNATNVAALVGVTVPTLNIWYRWKKQNPKHELAALLPPYKKIAHTRYWQRDSIESLIQFKQIKPEGRNGIMGKVTQAYVRKGK